MATILITFLRINRPNLVQLNVFLCLVCGPLFPLSTPLLRALRTSGTNAHFVTAREGRRETILSFETVASWRCALHRSRRRGDALCVVWRSSLAQRLFHLLQVRRQSGRQGLSPQQWQYHLSRLWPQVTARPSPPCLAWHSVIFPMIYYNISSSFCSIYFSFCFVLVCIIS